MPVTRAPRPGLDAVAESDAIERLQAKDLRGLGGIPGAAEALGALREDRVPVVTSATLALAAARLGVEPAEALVVLARDFGAVEVLASNYGALRGWARGGVRTYPSI